MKSFLAATALVAHAAAVANIYDEYTWPFPKSTPYLFSSQYCYDLIVNIEFAINNVSVEAA